jgi:hypothetical protein
MEVPYCNRCKLREADFNCDFCEPLKYFCANCDGYIHSSNAKRFHDRILIEKNREKVRSIEFDVFKSTNFNTPTNRLSVKSINTESTSNFERQHDKERINALDRQLDNVQSVLHEKIANLERQLEDNNKKFNLNVKILEDEHTLEIRRIINEKDHEIRLIVNKNQELESANQELNDTLINSQKRIEELENEYNEYICRSEYSDKRREYDVNEMKNYFDNKIKFLSESFEQEKSHIISNYERNLEKLTNGYKESKEKFINLLNTRENDINSLLQKMKNDELYFYNNFRKYCEIIENLRKDLTKSKEENERSKIFLI